MIDDKVQLDESKVSDKSPVVTETGFFAPACPLVGMFGGEDIWHDSIACIGSRFNTSEHLRKFKFLEHTPTELIEYFAVIDDREPEYVYPLWADKIDPRTLRIKRMYNIKAVARMHALIGGSGYLISDLVKQRLSKSFYCGREWNTLFDRAIRLDGLMTINSQDSFVSNMMALAANAEMIDHLLDEGNDLSDIMPEDVFYGISAANVEPISPTASAKMMMSDRLALKDLNKVLRPLARVNPASVYRPKNRKNHDGAYDGPSECDTWFNVLKYVEQIPYGEFFVRVRGDQHVEMHVHDPYNRPRKFLVDIAKDEEISESIKNISQCVLALTGSSDWVLYRSWNEEVYITTSIKTPEVGYTRTTTKRLYFDLMYAAIGSPMMTDEFFIG